MPRVSRTLRTAGKSSTSQKWFAITNINGSDGGIVGARFSSNGERLLFDPYNFGTGDRRTSTVRLCRPGPSNEASNAPRAVQVVHLHWNAVMVDTILLRDFSDK